MKKYLSLLLAIFLVLAVSGCRSSDADLQAVPTDPPAQTSPATTPTDPAPETQPDTNIQLPVQNPVNTMPGGTPVAFNAQYIRTDGYHAGAAFPRVVIIRTYDELQKYYSNNCGIFDLERKTTVYSDTTIGFLDACDKYDAAYFEENILLMVLLEEGSGSVRHEVTDVFTYESGELNIAIQFHSPEIGTCDMAQWHILIELNKFYDTDAANVYINAKAWKQPDSNPAA